MCPSERTQPLPSELIRQGKLSNKCVKCGAIEPDGWPHCTKCEVEELEWQLDPKCGAEFSEGLKDLIRKDIKILKRKLITTSTKD